MSGNLRFSPMFVALAISFCLFSGCDKKTKEAVTVLKRMETNYKSLKSFRANIRMERFNSQFGENDIYEGKFIYLKHKESAYARIDWVKPAEESLTLVNKQYMLYRPRLNQAISGNIDRPEVVSALKDGLDFLNKSKIELKADLTFKHLGKQKLSNGILTEHLEFTSKSAKRYKKIEFWTDKSGMLIQFKIIHENDDTTNVIFSNIEKNLNISPDIFKINLPKNTKIVKG